MKIDSHQHFWQYNPEEYSWINDKMKVIQRNLLPADLETHVKNFGFDGTVLVQARQTLEETEWILKLADENDFIKGVVGWLDICSTEFETQLERFARHKKLVGMRHCIQDEPNDRFMLKEEFMRGIAQLKKFDLKYDVLIHPRHLPFAAELVKNFPEQQFVLDHLAKPLIRDKELLPWAEDIEELASNANVFCKISGMVTEASWNDWNPEDFNPYMDVIYHSFGEDRIMIGSDWPVCLVAAKSYEEVMNLPIRYFKAKGLSQQAMDKFLGLNCARFYGIR